MDIYLFWIVAQQQIRLNGRSRISEDVFYESFTPWRARLGAFWPFGRRR
ncbi:hypothetical protein M8997_016050 [Phyllobacterium sp. 21LDTY02-6]|nr:MULTISPECIES: hypothetical protein [unclassified Phyllobacterium]MCO4318710.1 hypothetical protein [Phyllobacterium sp. 21LDTY02-6]MCX8281226.1 hypothetical protein [Phyllobacterium sp. 0TCS1.6C]MCX8294488.1 hypothetical protein [Phyllobacterium sp. 0TCS1.6A]